MTSSIAAKIRRTHAELRKGNPRADDETLLLLAIRAVETQHMKWKSCPPICARPVKKLAGAEKHSEKRGERVMVAA